MFKVSRRTDPRAAAHFTAASRRLKIIVEKISFSRYGLLRTRRETSGMPDTLGEMRAAVTLFSVYGKVWVDILTVLPFFCFCCICLSSCSVTASGRAGLARNYSQCVWYSGMILVCSFGEWSNVAA
jgi:hypothetical protein